MTRRERLIRTLQGLPVDRPPVSFYELNGHKQNMQGYTQNYSDASEYNIYNDLSWRGLLDLSRDKTDKIILCYPQFIKKTNDNFIEESTVDEDGSIHTLNRIITPEGELTQRTVRNKDINTVWITEHYIKTRDDIKKYLSVQDKEIGELDVSGVLECDRILGDSGIAAIDTSDALCAVASLFSMEDYLVFALTEKKLIKKMLEHAQIKLIKKITTISEALPGRLYRIYGPEYAAPPYLPPKLFNEYVTEYDKELISIIHKSGGYARVHSHGRLMDIIDSGAGQITSGNWTPSIPSVHAMSVKDARGLYQKIGKIVNLYFRIDMTYNGAVNSVKITGHPYPPKLMDYYAPQASGTCVYYAGGTAGSGYVEMSSGILIPLGLSVQFGSIIPAGNVTLSGYCIYETL